MKSLFGKIKDAVSSKFKEWELQNNTSAQKLATMNALNRRKNTRIRYPHIGAVGDLPKVFYRGEELIIGNISTGGLLVIDDTELLGSSVGSIVHLELQWGSSKIDTQARVVSAQLQRRHIQFVDFNATAFVRISKLIKPGFLGTRFHRVHDNNAMLDADELWVGPTGESLLFPRGSSETHVANLTMANQTLVVEKSNRPYWQDSNQVVDRATLGDILILLSNFPEPTAHIKSLIEKLQLHYEIGERQKATGTDG